MDRLRLRRARADAVGTRGRLGALAGTGLVHLALLLAFLLAPSDRGENAVPDRVIVTFDLTAPVLPPPVDLPPPPEPPRRPTRVAQLSRPASPDRRRDEPDSGAPLFGPRAPLPNPAAVLSADATLVPAAPAVPSAPLDGAGVALGSGDNGTGTGGKVLGGKGQGNGGGPEHGAGGPDYARAQWLHKPNSAEFLPFWPATATERRIPGAVLLECFVTPENLARDCTVLGETPAGIGFGDSAVRASRLFRIRPVMHGRERLDLPVRVPVFFDVTGKK